MSEAFPYTKASIKRLRENWNAADEDTQFRFCCWALGLLMMAAAIVAQFGWTGLEFCAGLLFWAVGSHKSGEGA